MNIVVYCQHVLGMGHFFRTLELIRALDRHRVILVTGGDSLPEALPPHVTHLALPGLMMDPAFNGLYSVDPSRSVDAVKDARRKLLLDLFAREVPDLFLVELYPFGRKAFRFELDPILEQAARLSCPVVCSLRDILVEKSDTPGYETRVVSLLNQWFDALLVHSDPRVTPLDATFSRLGDLKVPVVYTGFVTPRPDPGLAAASRQRLLGKNRQHLVVASAGSGSVGAGLLKTAAIAHGLLRNPASVALVVYTGPYMADRDVDDIQACSGPGVTVETFTGDFVSVLAGADLSVSMAGYNTCMNLLAAGVPAIVQPFGQNREQRMRVESLAGRGALDLLDESVMTPEFLASLMQDRLDCPDRGKSGDALPDLSGAEFTCNWIEARYGS